jgi:hypothetical protein
MSLYLGVEACVLEIYKSYNYVLLHGPARPGPARGPSGQSQLDPGVYIQIYSFLHDQSPNSFHSNTMRHNVFTIFSDYRVINTYFY